EEWPRVISTRRIVDDGGRYFGPYTSVGSANKTLSLLDRLFPYRKCSMHITGHDRACVYFHLGQCTAPCIAAVDRPTYMKALEQAAHFLDGNAEVVLEPLREEMAQAADAWNFERAADLRDRVAAIEHVIERQKIASASGTNADVLAVAQGAGGDAAVQVGFLRNGKLLGSEFFPMQARIDDTPDQILAGFIGQFYAEAAVVPPLLLTGVKIAADESAVLRDWLMQRRGGKVEIVAPQRGQKRQLAEMVAKSAAENLEQSRLKHLSDEQRMTAAMTELAEALELPRLPRRIECFDISTLHGTNTVASMVVFDDGCPSKRDYRRFAIKTVEGTDDFASMREVIRRRFRRAAEADADEAGKWTTLPDLVIVDGGKGQLGAALAALNEVGWEEQPIAALAKENEELFLPGRPDSVLLPRDSQALFLVQRIRDEAHRFAVTFHRQRRSRASLQSKLDDVPGIGPKRRQALIKQFGSVKAIKEASVEQLAEAPGITPGLAAKIKATL
ncbi:MAG TPA: excinuclease ABC subunit UvrC, partial [Thermomicrobiales bacterium]|nr:excinuclease ABC subunit UvrC [Thermomicrobiales bacterium]